MAAPPLILAEGLGKGYGGRTLFDDATFQVEEGQKVAIVGPNGAGKTTLLRILAGREKPDHGTLKMQPVTTHWFDQHPVIPLGATVGALLSAAAPAPAHLQAEWDELEARIADPALYEAPGYEAVLERYAELEREIKAATQARTDDNPIVAEMGFTADDLAQDAASLSGGEKTRLFLARALGAVRPGDLVVLDEPTNHLDVDSIEWLEEWLQDYKGTVLVVAHDRAFLDNVAERVFEVAQGHITCYTGNYEDYVAARDEDLERARRDHEKAQEKMQAAKETILQFRQQKRFDGQYASRMKQLEKYQAALDRTPDPVLEKLGFGLSFDAVEKSGHEVLRIEGLRKGYGDSGDSVLKGAELELKKGDRVGLVGGNGAGKSTLLKCLTGRLKPDGGSIRVAPGAKGMFFSQEHDDLDVRRTLHEEVLDARPGLEERDVKALLGRFRFKPEVDIRRTVSTLSGGERQRMMLLKCILKPSNLLILDEPTNHLDLWARDVVVHALNAYHGTLLVVSHDRFLLDSVTDKTAVLDGGTVQTYDGAFTATRHLHRRHPAAVAKDLDRYVVKKRFTEWSTNTRYTVGMEARFTPAQVRDSVTLRNAVAMGWLEKMA